MYFNIKNYLKNNCYYTTKYILLEEKLGRLVRN
jgi:hypothetical protein